LAAKISNRENNRILVETGSMSDISGQHFRVESRQQRPSGRIDRRISLVGEFMVVLAVYGEPVSIPNSLFIREFTGNFVVFAAKMEKMATI